MTPDLLPDIVTDVPRLPPRDPQGHKGTFGTVVVVGGQAGGAETSVEGRRTMLGAPALAARAALRGGAGLAVIAAPAPLLVAALALCPAATGVALPVDRDGVLDASGAAAAIDGALASATTLVLGPGFGSGYPQQQTVARLLNRDGPPTVLDADGLNALAELADFAREVRVPLIVTPHPGEFARLARGLGIAADPLTPMARPRAAAALARRLGCIAVLKGAGTVVSDGLRAWVNDTGNAALAVGGTGDVLAGLCGSMVAQFVSKGMSLFDCARLAVRLHGLAADRWAATHGSAGMLPTDLCDALPEVLDAERSR